jgi:phosphatidylglycerophosphatase A
LALTTSNKPNLTFLLQHPAHFFALGLGTGLAAKAPGTVGTLASLPLFWLISAYDLSTQLAIIATLFVIGVYVCSVTGKALGVVDHGSIVWDEIVAMMLVLTVTPNAWPWTLTAFLLFRLFDIWKPYPIAQLDRRIKNGLGVMLDDVLAAAYAMLVLLVLMWFI